MDDRLSDELTTVGHVELVDGEIDRSPQLLLALERKRRHGDVAACRPKQVPPTLFAPVDSSRSNELLGPTDAELHR
jgi:hypothetical protein